MRRSQALPVPPRQLFSFTELSSTVPMGINNADISTLECALLERMYYCEIKGEFVEPPPVSVGVYTARLSYFRKLLLERVGTATPVSLDEVVEMYKGRKRTIYQNALAKYEEHGLTRKDGYLNSFVKLEKVNPNKAPRCIQPRKPVYNLNLGRFIKPIEHRTYHAIDKIFGDGPTVMKGYNVQRIGSIIRGKWRTFNQPVAVGLDATKFDMHVSIAALLWEHSVYNGIYRSALLQTLLEWQIDNRGYGFCKDGSLRYQVGGRRASGDMNTALGNCLIMCALVHAYAKDRGVDVKLVNNGDDCVVMMEASDLQRFSAGLNEWFLEMGFRMAVEPPVYNLCEIEFCQMHPLEMPDGGCLMVRNIPTALRKDSLCTIDIRQERPRKAWLTAVGTGGLALTGGVPIMQNFYRMYRRLGGGVVSNVSKEITRNSGMAMLSVGVSLDFVEPSDEVRAQVYLAWGITPDEQVALERYYDEYSYDSSILAVDSHINDQPITHALSR